MFTNPLHFAYSTEYEFNQFIKNCAFFVYLLSHYDNYYKFQPSTNKADIIDKVNACATEIHMKHEEVPLWLYRETYNAVLHFNFGALCGVDSDKYWKEHDKSLNCEYYLERFKGKINSNEIGTDEERNKIKEFISSLETAIKNKKTLSNGDFSEYYDLIMENPFLIECLGKIFVSWLVVPE